MTWVDLSGAFGYGTKLTSTQMQNLRDNLTALANGDTGSPKIQNAAIAPAQVDYTKLEVGTQEQSQTVGAGAHYKFTLTGGGYCFQPRFKATSVDIAAARIIYTGSWGTSYNGPFITVTHGGSAGTNTIYCWHTYITATGEIYWLFLLIDKKTEEVLGMSICKDHPSYGHKIDPNEMPHPFTSYDPNKHQILLANPEDALIKKIEKTSPDSLLDGIVGLCTTKDGGTWPDIPITVDFKKKVRIPKQKNINMIELKWTGPKD